MSIFQDRSTEAGTAPEAAGPQGGFSCLQCAAKSLLVAYSVVLVFRGTASLQAILLLSAFLLLLFARRGALGVAWKDARWALGPLLLFSCWIFVVCGFWREPPLRSWDPGGWHVHQPWFSLDQWRRDIAQPTLALLCGWWAFRGERARAALFWMQAALILALAVKGLHQFLVGEVVQDVLYKGTLQVRGFSRDNIFFSYVLMLLSPGALWLAMRAKRRPVAWVSLLVLLAMVFLNKRRGTWVAIYVEFLVLLSMRRRRDLAIFLLSTLLLGGAAYHVRPGWFLRDYDLQRTGRVSILRDYRALTAEAPITGVGFGKDTVIKHYWPRIYQHAHNTFLNRLLELGWPGLAFWVAALAAYAFRFLRGWAQDPAARIGLAFLLAFCVRNLTDDVWIASNAELFWFQIGVLMPPRPERPR